MHPIHRLIEPVIFEMKPLADSEIPSIPSERLSRRLGRTVLAQEPHVKMPVVRRTLRLAMPRRRRPCFGKIVKTIPVDALGFPDQEFGGSLQAPVLHFLCPEARHAHFAYPD